MYWKYEQRNSIRGIFEQNISKKIHFSLNLPLLCR